MLALSLLEPMGSVESRRIHVGAAGDASVTASALNPLGSAIHQNLADRLRAARVPGQVPIQEGPAGRL